MRIELYIYVDGSDNEDIADNLLRRITEFVVSTEWVCEVVVVNDRSEPAAELGEDLPEWNIGVNLTALEVGDGYWRDVSKLLAHFGDLRQEFGRDFVVGIGGEDRLHMDGAHLSAEDVRTMLTP